MTHLVSRRALLGAALLCWGCQPPAPRRAAVVAPVALSFEPLPLRLVHTFTITRGSLDAKVNGLLRLTAEGVTGLGEAAPSKRYQQNFETGRAAFPSLQQAVAGKSPWAHREWLEAAEQAVGRETALVAALDAALWDWRGKKLGQPVHRLIGTPSGRMPPTSFSIGMDEPATMARHAAEAVGYRVLKVKLGLAGEREMLAAVRQASPPSVAIRVDANEGWSPADLEEKLRWLVDQGVELVEQPLPVGREAELRPWLARAGLPLVADESAKKAADLPTLVGAFHGVNVKLIKCGGITRALEMITAARKLGLRIMLGCGLESSLGIAAAIPLAPFVDWVDLDGNLLLAGDPFVGLRFEQGRWLLPVGPGLGVVPRPTRA